jgi:alpha-1,3-rhamnosyl/mannosyltransferase
MAIAIDATPLMKAHRTGIARYVVNLVRALAPLAAADEEFLLCYRLSRLSRRAHRLSAPGPGFRSAWIQGSFHPRGISVAHGPDHRLLRIGGARKIVTVHDVFSLLSDEFASKHFREKMTKRLREVAGRADRILCVSSWTRDRFWDHFPLPEERFLVIGGGVEDRFHPDAAERLPGLRSRIGLAGPYLLHVGELSVRKNIPRLLDVMEILPPDAPRLVLAGRPSYGHEAIEREVAARGLTGRVLLTGYFPDEDLPTLYAGAECLLYPSLMEGFGLPVLEAQACGTPVVCSDRGALLETSGGVRLGVDPEDPESIRDAVLRLLDDSDLRSRLSAGGIGWAGQYRWSRVAKRTLDVYREAS